MSLTAIGVIYWQIKKPAQVPPSTPSQRSQTPTPFTFSLQPPAQALSAQATTFSGGVKKNTRTDLTMLPVSPGSPLTLIEGEAVQTDASGSAQLRFGDHTALDVSVDSEFSLTNTLPTGFLVRQSRGQITYEQLQTERSTSIRALNTLIVLPSGKATISVDPTTRTIEISGTTEQLQFAFIDTDNETQLYTLKPGQNATIDDTAKDVRIENN